MVTRSTDEANSEPQDTRPLRQIPAVRRLGGSFWFSAIGSAMVAVASAYVAYDESGSTVLTVLVLAAYAFPAFVLSPLTGRLATRLDPRTVELAGFSAKVVLSAVVAVIAGFGALTYTVLLAMNLVNGTISALTNPAWPRLKRMSAPEGRLAEMTAAFSGLHSSAAIIGAVAGGLVISGLGAAWVFAINAVSYLPLIVAVRLVPGEAPSIVHKGGAVRAGIDVVRRSASLRQAFILAGALNLAAWPVLSMLPAVASEIDGRGHVLGLLIGSFYGGAIVVAVVVRRLRRRLPYSRILYGGFLAAGLLLLGHSVLTAWRDPGLDAVTTAVVTLIPIGLAVALNASLLQALVQLGAPARDQGPVLVVYATVTTILTPLGGLAIGALADFSSVWYGLAVSGALLALLAVVLRSRLSVFDELGEDPVEPPPTPAHHLHLAHLLGFDHVDAMFPFSHVHSGTDEVRQ